MIDGEVTGTGAPEGALDLLARAALAPEAEARAAWRTWRLTYDIDATPWNEVRLLGSVAKRIGWLEPDAAIRPRILGIRKFLWVQSQICLKTAVGGLRTIAGAGIPLMLLKGTARIARDPAAIQERLIRDVDVLVPVERQGEAQGVLETDGWSMLESEWHMKLRRRSPIAAHHAWTMVKDKSVIDLHHFSNFLNRLQGDDDGLWQRAQQLRWQGTEVLLPSPADSLLIALTHGVRWSSDHAADWTVDAAGLLDEHEIDWAIFLREARQRTLQAVLLVGLTYLRDALQRPVPEGVIAALQLTSTPEREAERDIYVRHSTPQSWQESKAAGLMAIRRAMMRAGIRPLHNWQQRPRTRIERLSIMLEAGRSETWFRVPSDKCTTQWILIRILLAWPEHRAGEAAFGKFRAPGLGLGAAISSMEPDEAGQPVATFRLRLPVAFVQLRQIPYLAFRHLTATGEGERTGDRTVTIDFFELH